MCVFCKYVDEMLIIQKMRAGGVTQKKKKKQATTERVYNNV